MSAENDPNDLRGGFFVPEKVAEHLLDNLGEDCHVVLRGPTMYLVPDGQVLMVMSESQFLNRQLPVVFRDLEGNETYRTFMPAKYFR